MELLKLVALDRDDLEVVSTHLQDATLTVGDVRWRPTEKRLVMSLARFDWAGSLGESAQFQRRRTALRFDRVNAIKCRNVDCKDKQAMLNLLAIEFDESDPPGGVVTLICSGGAALRLDVECLECELVDLGPVWTETCRPIHAEDVDDVRTA
ncbi:MAG TPA: DUF2948 family protein [Xanthobacteraceae bacterium]|jgi:hypothetical protein|nr:DUF2948 family protein [Xanthobacteraceae bacterium]